MGQQNIEMTKEASDWYASVFPTARQGVTRVVETAHSRMEDHPVSAMFDDPERGMFFMLTAWANIYRHSLSDMASLFEANELCMLIEAHQGAYVYPYNHNKSGITLLAGDAMSLDNMAEKWKIETEHFSAAIEKLTPTQAMCLQLWAVGYWTAKKRGDPTPLKDYVTQLS